MRHSVHVMFGKAFAKALLELKQYIVKYGNIEIDSYFTALLFVQDEKETISEAQIEDVDNEKFTSGILELYQAKLHKIWCCSNHEEYDVRLKDFILNLRNNTITIQNPGDYSNLHFCLYVPLYEEEICKQAISFIQISKSLNFSVDVDIVGISADMAGLFVEDNEIENLPLKKNEYNKQTSESIRSIIEFRKKNFDIEHFLVLQNTQRNGISLALNFDSYISVVGEMSLIMVEAYQELFTGIQSRSDLQAIGVSMIGLDKYYFIEYLLHKSYISLLDREKVKGDKNVDINKTSQISNSLLKKWVDLMDEIFTNEVKKRQDKGESDENIVIEINPILDCKFQEMRNDFQIYFEDNTMSLPFKKAILASLLGQDDEYSSNILYNTKQLIIDY